MPKITVSLPEACVDALDSAANHARCSRAEIIHRAIEHYLEDFEDLSSCAERLRDSGDSALPWEKVKDGLLGWS